MRRVSHYDEHVRITRIILLVFIVTLLLRTDKPRHRESAAVHFYRVNANAGAAYCTIKAYHSKVALLSTMGL